MNNIIQENLNQELFTLRIPQLGKFKRGKVRDNHFKDGEIVMIATDRISAFDHILKQQIPFKGQVLSSMTKNWIKELKGIMPYVDAITDVDPNVIIAKECEVLPIEFVCRRFLTGSLWENYKKEKDPYDLKLPKGLLKEYHEFENPTFTLTTKAEKDEPLTQQAIVETGLLDKATLDMLVEQLTKVFEKTEQKSDQVGLTFVDTKYEIGKLEDTFFLIDEVNTADSSRYVSTKNLEDVLANKTKELMDYSKEFVRKYLKSQGFSGKEGQSIPNLPDEVRAETAERYINLHDRLFNTLPIRGEHVANRILENLHSEFGRHQYIRDTRFVQIIAGSPSDTEHCEKISNALYKENVSSTIAFVSAHKQAKSLDKLMGYLPYGISRPVIIAVAGLSNGLGPVLAGNYKDTVVINCPPFKDMADYNANIHSSVQLPPNVPAATLIDPTNAAQYAARIIKREN